MLKCDNCQREVETLYYGTLHRKTDAFRTGYTLKKICYKCLMEAVQDLKPKETGVK